MSRAIEVVSKVPLTTLVFTAICVGTYVYQILLDPELDHFTMNPKRVLYKWEFYRIITSCFFHGNMMHIGMNMISFLAIGGSLEANCGSLWTGVTITLSIILTGVIYLLIALIASLLDYDKLMKQHSLGFSGILFHLLVLESARNPNASQSIFGMTRVSSKVYPWAMLILMQVLLPNISFTGHLSGILCGTMQSSGCFNSIFPSLQYLRSSDESSRLRFMTSKPNYVKTPSSESAFAMVGRQGSTLGAISSAMTTVRKFVSDKVGRLKVVIFGRGRAGNENISLDDGRTTTTEALIPAGTDEEKFVGLSTVPENPRESTIV